MEIKRNLKTLENKTGQKIIEKINRMMADHGKYKNSYFWSTPSNASSRRNMEFREELKFKLGGKKYEWAQELSCSCKNVYWASSIYVDGSKKTIAAIKKIMK